MTEIMSDAEPSNLRPAGEALQPFAYGMKSGGPSLLNFTSFSKAELNDIFLVYGHKVREGEWRDYAIDILKDKAIFSVYRRAAERPIYRIEKTPKQARKQGIYSVIATTGLILKRGHDLKKVLRVLDKGLKLVKF